MAEAMYRQIADDLRGKIESGEIAPGAQLPTEIGLMDEYKASRNTIRDAIKLLAGRGLVEARAGQGTFVVESINPLVTAINIDLADGFGADDGTYLVEAKARRRSPQAQPPRVDIQDVSEVSVPELRLPEDATVIRRQQQRYIDKIPWSLQTSFYSQELERKGAELLSRAGDIKDGAVHHIEETCHIELAGWEDKYRIRAPNKTESSFFKLPDDGRVAVIENRRTGFDRAGEPFVLTVTVYPADRNQFVVNVGQVPAADEE